VAFIYGMKKEGLQRKSKKMEVCICLSQDYSIFMWILCAAYVF
jgi:hypothetical protein